MKRSPRHPWWVVSAAFLAFVLSLAYLQVYLRGGSRIIDATSYWLEARTFTSGHFGWAAGQTPTESAGRFLVRDTLGDGEHLTGIFPPGYPALLALGFLARVPLLVGPILGALLVFSTARLVRAAGERARLDEAELTLAVRGAAFLSALSACLRYHTADTMSHGLAALLFSFALGTALQLADGKASLRRALFLGAALGWLVATRPMTGVAAALGCAAAVLLSSDGPRRWRIRWPSALAGLIGAIPGLALLALHQHAATGAWFRSSQSLYYAVSDGPPGCFGYGFGQGIGCRIEHGQFVRDNLENGFGTVAAIATTARRLKAHAGDALNAWILAPITLFALYRALSRRATAALGVGVLLLVAVYAPFYFDGNYPGGGARFYADGLPLEHAALGLLAARGIVAVKKRGTRILSLSLLALLPVLGFVFFGSADAVLLRDREGGRPMFEPARLESLFARAEANGELPPKQRPVVFFDTDHGFNLAFDPRHRDRYAAMRYHGDLTDYLALSAYPESPAFLYSYSFETGQAQLVGLRPTERAPLEAESLWPPLSQTHGYVQVSFDVDASAGRWLELISDGNDEASVELDLPQMLAGQRIVPTVRGRGQLEIFVDGKSAALWNEAEASDTSPRRLESKQPPRAARNMRLRLSRVGASSPAFGLDCLSIDWR